jgi:hypothetical protein
MPWPPPLSTLPRARRLGTPPASTIAATAPLMSLARCPLPLRHLTHPLGHKEADNTTPSHLSPCHLPRASFLLSMSALTSPLRYSSSATRLLSTGKLRVWRSPQRLCPASMCVLAPCRISVQTTTPGQAPAATTSSMTLLHAPPHLTALPPIARPLLPPSSTGRAVAFPRMPCVCASI